MKNLKKLLSLLALSTLATGFSIAEGASPLPLEGSWGMRAAEGEFTFDMTFTIQNNTLTLTNLCTFQGKTATARVSSPAQYDERSLTVLASADDQESRDGVDCNVSLKPDRMNYRVAGPNLILSHDGSGDQMVLTRK